MYRLAALAIPFVFEYSMGAIGTGGREAVGELSAVLLIAVIGIGGGAGAWRTAGKTVTDGGVRSCCWTVSG